MDFLEQTFGALEGSPTKYVHSFFEQGTGMEEHYGLTNKSWSIFGNIDFDVTERLRLTIGGNYTQDRKRFSAVVDNDEVFSTIVLDDPAYAPMGDLSALKPLQFMPQYLNLPNEVEPGRTRDKDFAWNVRAAYKLTDTVNVYATYATGFKASSVNLSRDARPLASDMAAIKAAGLDLPNLVSGTRFAGPEESEVYEFGLKGQWSVAAVNLAVFKQSIKGFQSNIFTGTGFALANAGKQSTMGFEFDGSVRPADGLNLNLAVTYLDPKFDSFVNSAFGDISGRRPAGIPDLSVTAGATYTHHFSGGARAILHGDYQYESPVQVVDGFLGFGSVPAGLEIARGIKREVNQFNASVTVALPNGLELGLWGRNLTNQRYLITAFDAVAQQGSISGYANQPRTYGGTVRYKF